MQLGAVLRLEKYHLPTDKCLSEISPPALPSSPLHSPKKTLLEGFLASVTLSCAYKITSASILDPLMRRCHRVISLPGTLLKASTLCIDY